MTASAFLKNRDSWLRAVVEDAALSHSTVRVAVHIAMRMNGNKQSGAWPSVATISKSANVSVRSVLTAIDELSGVDKKTGEVVSNRYLIVERKRNVGNRYWLNFFWQ